MDFQSLVAVHMINRRLPTRMGAAAEDRYHGAQVSGSRPGARFSGQLAMMAGLILFLASITLA